MKSFFLAFLFLPVAIWAQNRYTEIDPNSKSFEEFEIFGDTLDSYRIYFTGENHMFADFNTDLEYKFLTYLHQTQGLRHFIFEQSPAVGYIIEKIIIDGKTTHQQYLQDIFYDPFYGLVKKIRKYNDTLSAEDKIHIHGIDAERFPYFSIYALDAIVDTLDTRFEGGELFEQIKALASAHYDDFSVGTYYDEPNLDFEFDFGQVHAWASLKSIIDGANELKDTLMPRLGQDGPIFYAIIKSLEVGREWYLAEKAGDVKSPIIRERYMCDEFERIYREDPSGKFYGQFGRCHLHKDKTSRNCYDYYINSVASRITEIDKSLEHAVLVIPIFYTKNRQMDGEIIAGLDLEPQFKEEGTAFIIDMEYKGGNHSITGFFDKLPFVIICNMEPDGYEDTYFTWDIPLEEFHLGAYYGYRYQNAMRKLNSALVDFGSAGFTNKFVAYTFFFDYLTMNDFGGGASFTYMPPVSNNDGFEMNGYQVSVSSFYPFGNRFIMGFVGYDWAYGRMILTEQTDNTIPNLIQANGQNVNIYRNDMFLVDPNIGFRLTMPVLSFNFKAGYGFDISGKYWKLDGKMKDFAKTSFSAPYIQAGLSLNIKYR